jgi:hypothetical protein
MRRLSILILALALVALDLTSMPAGVAAQDNPQASPAARQPRGVSPEECQVEPRSGDEVFALLGLGGEAGEASPAPRTPVPAPPWMTADEETAAAVEAAVREWLACINADDNARISALMTDAALTRFFATLGTIEEIEQAQANFAGTPVPRAEEERARLIGVSDISLLEDGRIAALALVGEPALPPGGQETLLLIFVSMGDRLLIDDIIQFSVAPVPAGTPVAGTPQP